VRARARGGSAPGRARERRARTLHHLHDAPAQSCAISPTPPLPRPHTPLQHWSNNNDLWSNNNQWSNNNNQWSNNNNQWSNNNNQWSNQITERIGNQNSNIHLGYTNQPGVRRVVSAAPACWPVAARSPPS